MSLDTPTKAICTVRLGGWVGSSSLAAVALGWLAFQISGIWSPMWIFPLLVGGLLGMMLVVLMRTCQVHAAWIVYPVAVLAVALVVVSQHWLAYRETLSTVNKDIQRFKKAATAYPDEFQGTIPVPPKNWIVFLSDEARHAREISTWFGTITLQGATAWTFWGIDALLVLLSVLLLLWKGRARTWCPTCRSWYRVTRKGRLSLPDAEKLLALVKEKPEENNQEKNTQRFATFLIRNCEGHCGKTELTVLIPATSTFETLSLDNDQRHMVEAFLDK